MDCGDEETGIEVLIPVQDIGGRCAMMHLAYGLPMVRVRVRVRVFGRYHRERELHRGVCVCETV